MFYYNNYHNGTLYIHYTFYGFVPLAFSNVELTTESLAKLLYVQAGLLQRGG